MSAPQLDAATMDGRPGADHTHRYAPRPDGRLYGKVRWRNRCTRCGLRQHPIDRAEYLPVGPLCRRCGTPTVAGVVDPEYPLHPCCETQPTPAPTRETEPAVAGETRTSDG